MHRFAHDPQLVGTVRLASQPLVRALLSQFAKPALQAMAQALFAQLAAPFIPLHPMPQPPQWATERVRSVSHPFAATPSQLPHPASQLTTVHALAAQPAVARGSTHARPQPPQWEGVTVVFTSHPFAALPSQLPKPAVHVPTPQAPAVHTPVAWAGAQGRMQPPQWGRLVAKFASHPSVNVALQSPKPELQTPPQRPEAQAAWAFAGAGHAVVQVPQCVGSVWRLKQLPVQKVVGEAQTLLHAPFEQTCPAAQALPQAPQFADAVLMFTSHPFAAAPSQLPNPVEHGPTVHIPPAHPAVVLGRAHCLPQAPQWAGVAAVFTSQPFAVCPSQFALVPVHCPITHWPIAQAAVALGREQALLQAPQCAEEVVRFTSQPSDDPVLQSPKPALQRCTTQLLEVHPAVAFGSAQTLPHIAQCVAVTRRSVSQPFAALPSQLPKLAMHAMPQTPMAQTGAPPAELHALPQRPQCEGLVASGASQPFAGSLSQSPKPMLQAPIAHRPITQAAVALARVHARPHIPHCPAVLRRSTSQPLAGLLSQSPKPAEHIAITQRPAEQAAVALGSTQALPHIPQELAVVFSEVSHPLAGEPSQSPKPALHSKPQRLVAQVGRAFAGAWHALPQPPQWATEVTRSAHCPVQFVCPAGQFDMHPPLPQTRPAVQGLPQRPQWVLLPAREVSQPFAGLVSQSPKPALQTNPQRAAAQVGVALAGAEQAIPHIPQWVGATRRSVSQPLVRLPSQSPRVISQTVTHAPFMHAGCPLGDGGHWVPQAPQCEGFAGSSTSHPFAGFRSQSPKRWASEQRA